MSTGPFPQPAIVVREETLSAAQYQRAFAEQSGNIRRVTPVCNGLGNGWPSFKVEYKRPLIRFPYAGRR